MDCVSGIVPVTLEPYYSGDKPISVMGGSVRTDSVHLLFKCGSFALFGAPDKKIQGKY